MILKHPIQQQSLNPGSTGGWQDSRTGYSKLESGGANEENLCDGSRIEKPGAGHPDSTPAGKIYFMTDFDPEQHRFCKTKYFEDLKVGERFYLPSRTMTDALFAAFQLASGDNHPIHYDVEYCKARGHSGMLAHGFQVLVQTAAGAGVFPHVIGDSMIGFIEQSSKFLKPVYSGDTLYPLLEIVELRPGRTTGVIVVRSTVHNQRRELCMEGLQSYLVRKRPA